MARVNYWRVAAIVLLAVVIVSAYRAAIPGERPPASTAGEAGDSDYVLTLRPGWSVVRLAELPPPAEIEFTHPYKFARDWHTRHVRYWEQALATFRGQTDVRYLEIGLFEGASFFWVLEHVLTHPTSRATGMDPFFTSYSDTKHYGDTFYENLQMSGQSDRCTIIKGFSQVELRKLPLDSYDIIYIDGSHEAVDVLEDAVLSWRLLKPGGVMIFDDYQLWLERPSPHRPQAGIDAFYAFFGGQFDVVHLGYQVMLKRRPLAPAR
jgi:hypothetical protein